MIRTVCGNSIEEMPKINAQLKGDFVVVTDPPFNVGYKYREYRDNMETDEHGVLK